MPKQQDEKQRQHMHGITLSLDVEQESYAAGSHIIGTVFLDVPSSGCGDYSGIHLVLKGEESVRVDKKRLDVTFFAMETEVVRFPPDLTSGRYEYPFYWKIPASLPCSMVCSSEESVTDSSCEVCYDLATFLKHKDVDIDVCKFSDKEEGDRVRSIKIEAPSSPMQCTGGISHNDKKVQRKEGKVAFDPSTTTVRSLLRNKGTIDIGIDVVDKTVVPGESNSTNLSICVTGRNQSSVPVDHLLLKLSETVEWSNGVSGFDSNFHKRTLSEKVISVDKISAWQPRSRKKQDGNSRGTKAMEAITVSLPCKDASDSFAGDILRISHSLQVIAVTKGKHVTNAKLKTYVLLHRQAATMEEQIREHGHLIESKAGHYSHMYLFTHSDCGIDFSNLDDHPGALRRRSTIPEFVTIKADESFVTKETKPTPLKESNKSISSKAIHNNQHPATVEKPSVVPEIVFVEAGKSLGAKEIGPIPPGPIPPRRSTNKSISSKSMQSSQLRAL